MAHLSELFAFIVRLEKALRRKGGHMDAARMLLDAPEKLTALKTLIAERMENYDADPRTPE